MREPSQSDHANTSASSPVRSDFGRLLSATAISNVGNGISRAAGPLLVVQLTSDPVLVAAAGVTQHAPWLLFSLPLGAVVDRTDRRRLVVTLNLLRGVVLAALAVAVATELVTVPAVLVALFVMGIGEVAADNGAVALLPAVVRRDQLERANSWLMTVFLVGDQLGAPPLGAVLFAVTAALPFGVDAVSFVLAAILIAGIRSPTTPRDGDGGTTEDSGTLAAVRAGLAWLWGDGVLRLLAVLLGVMNVVFGAGFAVYVLYATQRLGLSEFGFGLLLSAGAVGGLFGSAVAVRLRERFGTVAVLRVGLVVETATHFLLGSTTTAPVAFATMAIFGIHAIVWGVLTISLRQRIVPDQLLGRVNGAYQLIGTGGMAIGTVVGGLVADRLGLAAPFLTAGAAMIVVTFAAWPALRRLSQPTSDGAAD